MLLTVSINQKKKYNNNNTLKLFVIFQLPTL